MTRAATPAATATWPITKTSATRSPPPPTNGSARLQPSIFEFRPKGADPIGVGLGSPQRKPGRQGSTLAPYENPVTRRGYHCQGQPGRGHSKALPRGSSNLVLGKNTSARVSPWWSKISRSTFCSRILSCRVTRMPSTGSGSPVRPSKLAQPACDLNQRRRTDGRHDDAIRGRGYFPAQALHERTAGRSLGEIPFNQPVRLIRALTW